jgi:hypothetical protein
VRPRPAPIVWVELENMIPSGSFGIYKPFKPFAV